MSSKGLVLAVSCALISVLLTNGCTDASLEQKQRTSELSSRIDPASVAVCDSLKARISQRSADTLRLNGKLGIGMTPSMYNSYLKDVEPRVQALTNIEERLYGIWRIVGDTGLCQDSMAVLANNKTANEVAHFVRSHDLAESMGNFYDDEFRVLAQNDSEWRYVDNLTGVWGFLIDLESQPSAVTQILANESVPRIGVNVFSQRDAAKVFEKLQHRLDMIYSRLPMYGQLAVARALTPKQE